MIIKIPGSGKEIAVNDTVAITIVGVLVVAIVVLSAVLIKKFKIG